MTTKLLPFHEDVLSEVFFFLDPPSLAQCAQVNSAFYTHAVPRLYRSIVVDLEADTDKLTGFMRAHRADFVSGRMGPRDLPWVLVPVLADLARPRLGVDLRELVRHVDLDTHQITACADTGVLPALPGLRSLRLTLHQSSILQGVQHYSLHPWDFAACGVLAAVSIPRLVVRNAPLLYARPSAQLAPPASLLTCEETVLSLFPDQAVVGTNMKFEAPACGLAGLLRAMPPSTRRLTLVFWTDPTGAEHGPGRVWRPQPRPLPDGEGGVLATSWAGRFFGQLARFARAARTAVTVVNAGSVDPAAILEPADTDHSGAHVQDTLEALVRRTVPEERVRFCRMQEYMRSGEAEGVFDDEEFGLWM